MSRLIKIADWPGEKLGSVIFVHGLGGHPYNTWRRRYDDKSFWPLWLAEDVKGLTVFSLGYISPPTNWLGTAMPLLDESANILRLLLSEPELRVGPISFVCHSLGGLIIKQILRSAKEQRSNPTIADLFDRTRQVVFIATPHTGSGKASLMELASFLVWGSDSAKDLVANKPELRDLNVAYRGLAEERREQLQHLVYYEMVNTPFGRIVWPDSADPGLPNCRPIPIREDHNAICKPRSRHDLIYAETKGFIAQLSNVSGNGNIQTYKLKPFNVEWSWKHLIPKLIRLSVLVLIVAGVWRGVQKYVDSAQNTEVTDQKLDQLIFQLEVISKQLMGKSTAAAAPDAEKAVRTAVQTAAEGAAAGDQRFVAALGLLKQGKTVEAERLFRAVAEEKAAQVKNDSSAAAAAFRNLGAIAGLSDPNRAKDAYGRALTFNPDDMESLYWYGWLNQLRGSLTLADQSLSRLLKVASAAGDRRGTYRADLRLGEVNVTRGNLILGLAYQNNAMATAAKQADANPGDLEWQRDLSISHEKIGDVLHAQGNLTGALENYKTSLSLVDRLATLDPTKAEWQRDISVSYNKIGDVLLAQGNLPGALENYKAAFSIRDHLAKADIGNVGSQRDLSISFEKIGDVLQAQRKPKLALESYRASLAIRDRLAVSDPSNAGWRHDISIAKEKMGDVLQILGDLSTALEHYKASLAIRDHLVIDGTGNAVWKRDLGVSHAKIGNALRAQGNLSAALTSFNVSLVIRDSLAKSDPGNAGWQADLALGHALVGQLHAASGDNIEAVRCFRAAREILAPLAERSGNPVWLGYVQNFDAEVAALQK